MPSLTQHCRTFLTVVLCLVLATACQWRGSATGPQLSSNGLRLFNHHIIDLHPPGGSDCCTDVASLGDIDADGDMDVIIGSENATGPGLVWYEYPTWQRHDIATGQFSTDMQAIDFDRDGDVDIVVADVDSGIAWFENSPGAAGWKRHALAPGYVHDLVVADINQDGIDDIVTADKNRVVLVLIGPDRQPTNIEVIIEQAGEGLDVADLDADGDNDILYSNLWFEQDNGADDTRWLQHPIAPSWPADTRILARDINADGQLDVVLSVSEGEGPLSWFESTDGRSDQDWREHRISTGSLTGVHSLQVIDVDGDGDIDILAAEMHTSDNRRIQVFLNEKLKWKPVELARHGSHNMVAGDVDNDGDIDLVGKNYGGENRFVEYWENRATDLAHIPDRAWRAGTAHWTYQPISTSRPESDQQKFGLLVRDLNDDGLDDVIAGGTIFHNAGTDLQAAWQESALPPGTDAIYVTEYAENGWHSIIAVTENSLIQLRASDESGKQWNVTPLGALPAGRTQGWAVSQPDQNNERHLFFTRETFLYRLDMLNSTAENWNLTMVQSGVQEEGVAIADLDGDLDDDILVVAESGRQMLWLENLANGDVQPHKLGASLRWIDRLAIADINGDGRNDIIFTEESRDADYNTRVAWLEAPENPRSEPWATHLIVVLRSANSLTVTDLDNDGDADIVVAEHTDFRPDSVVTDNFTGVFYNSGNGQWLPEIIEIGPHSSHLGAKMLRASSNHADSVISAGWMQSCCIHRWVRDTPPN